MANPLPLSALRRLIVDLLPAGHPGIEQTTRRLGIPVRTLQRRLREGGLSYRELVAAVRFKEARRLLSDSTMHLEDVADRLGFADPSSFSRAFRRWSGVSPRDFRRQPPAILRHGVSPAGRRGVAQNVKKSAGGNSSVGDLKGD